MTVKREKKLIDMKCSALHNNIDLGKSSASQILFILGRITPFIRKSSGYWNFNDQDMKIIRMSNVPFFYG